MEDIITIYNKTNNFGKENNFILNIIADGEITYEMKVEEKHLATPTTIHGGVISALMDATIGVAALSATYKKNQLVSTIEYKTNFIRPAFLGDTLKGYGKVDNKGNRIVFSSGSIYNQKNELIATGSGTFNAYPFEKSDIAQFYNTSEK